MSTLFCSVFGGLDRAQLLALSTAGFHILTADGPAEAETVALATKAKLRPIIRPAAWNVLDHSTSQVTSDRGRDGEPREYNRNGGFTRDFLLVAESHLVVVGEGVGERRLANIKAAAEAHGKRIKHVRERLVESSEPTAEQIAAAVDALPF